MEKARLIPKASQTEKGDILLLSFDNLSAYISQVQCHHRWSGNSQAVCSSFTPDTGQDVI